uniref:Uncharacterized protein n=1 Tax=Heterorhabditis bacteriophora TaxID=37862 RepID=A0A1I7WTJ1_HETBA
MKIDKVPWLITARTKSYIKRKKSMFKQLIVMRILTIKKAFRRYGKHGISDCKQYWCSFKYTLNGTLTKASNINWSIFIKYFIVITTYRLLYFQDELDLNSTLEGSIIQHDINNVDLSYLDFGIGEVFLEKWLLLHKIDGNSRRGVSYLVHDGIKLEGILRAEPLSSPHNTVMNEAIFLEKQSLANKSYLFNEVLDLKRVNGDSKNGFTYIVTLFRCETHDFNF